MKKFKLYGIVISLALLVSVFGASVVVQAQGQGSVLDKLIELFHLVKSLDSQEVELEDVGAFTSPGTHLTDLAVANDMTVGDEFTVTGVSTFNGYSDGVFFYEDNTLTDATSTISYACNSSGLNWEVQRVALTVPASAAGGGADAFIDRVIDFSVSANQYSSSTSLFAYNLSYTTSTSRASFSWDSATSTLQTVPVVVADTECVTAYINAAASSTISTNTDGVFQVWYKLLN